MKTTQILQPQYVSRFQCIGPVCEETCCQTWNVEVGKRTYQKYRGCPDLQLRGLLDKYVTRKRSGATDSSYAKIKMKPDGYCAFWDAERLCSLQRTFGEDFLSDTCVTYPRSAWKVDGRWETALDVSCPEAARVVLLNPNLMEFDYVLGTSPRCNGGYFEFSSAGLPVSSKAERHFWPLRIFSISLLQNRTYPLWQRLTILGLFCQAFEQLADPNEIPAVIEQYTNYITQGAFREELELIPTKDDVQLDLFGQLMGLRLEAGSFTLRFLECVARVKTAIAPEDGMSQDVVVGNFKQALESYYLPVMADREYILENYLVNYVFKNTFPFRGQGVFADYVMLATHYAIIKMMLIGLAGYYKDTFSLEHIIQLVYSFSRTIEHHRYYLDSAYKMFVENNLNTMACMAVLIRN